MLVTLLTDMPTGKSGMVRSHGGEWPAVWVGTSPGVGGVQYDVEIEVDDEHSKIEVCGSNSPREGIYLKDEGLKVCGTVNTVYEDGIIALDLKPGNLLLEIQSQSSEMHVGQVVCVSPSVISIFPTGI
ncbi:hypothetical protein [Nocardia ignorata]|uniref:TOBE domain-containing protein n=1 Tax=Nocardia ignorata TaxID=145285 RepID=A0A4R6PWS0_NOCIG|nr:hypothetical protein [Nocardia ignorata]TDP42630.1 hypothetical protein DFR75_1011744 [Nocardia ignorata]